MISMWKYIQFCKKFPELTDHGGNLISLHKLAEALKMYEIVPSVFPQYENLIIEFNEIDDGNIMKKLELLD